VIQAALNGGRTRVEHHGIPISPKELAESAKESVFAGARSIHFHVRAAGGRESLDSKDAANAISAVRSAVPGTPVGVSTGAWILRNVARRHEAISGWTVLPDFASVNLNEEGALPLAELLLSRGIGMEAGLSDGNGTQIFILSGLAPRCLRILLEPFETTTKAALKTLEQIEGMLESAGIKLPILFHGLNQTAWDLIDVATERGYDTRVGFEDVLTLPDRRSAPGNGALVAEVVRRMNKPRTR
jgi:uncharacterized protein (DUF849 family)